MPGQDNIIHTLVDTIQGSVDQFNESLSGVEQRLVDEILEITKELEVSAAGKIKNSIANLKLIMQIKNKLQKIIVSKKYKDSIREFIKTFEKVSDLQDQYFKNYIGSKKAQLPEEKLKLIREYSINSTIASLTEYGLNVNILDKVEDIIRQNTTTGGSYSSLQGQLRDFILSDKNTDGALVRYTKTITTDAINQYSRQYMETTAADLDMPWRKYIGSLKTTSREWCERMVAKKFIHVSELPELVKGNIDGHQCGIYKKTADNKGTDLPYGMIAGTNAQNVLVRAGGHGCEHNFYPCDEDEVPKEILDKFNNKEKVNNETNKTNFIDKHINDINVNYKNTTATELESIGLNKKALVNIAGGVFNEQFELPNFTVSKFDSSINIISKNKNYKIERTLDLHTKVVENNEFEIFDKSQRGSGNGIKAFVNQVNELRNLGFKEMEVSAALGSNYNGSITWAKFGYELTKDGQVYFDNLMSQNSRKEKSLIELMSTQDGEKFWENNSYWFNGTFDLSSKSINMNALESYIEKRKLGYKIN